MKKNVSFLLCAGLLAALMTGCGGSGNGASAAPAASEGPSDAAEQNGYEMITDAGIAESEQGAEISESVYDGSKLILRGSITAEATDFEAAVAGIEQQVGKAGGYIEESSVNGSTGSRWARFTLRVPREQFETTFQAVGDNCHVIERSRSSENVSADYYDSEARKTALETKRDRLLALLEKADKMEDIIALETALSEVQYEIESLSGTLRNYDRLISFSTIEVYLEEVRDLSLVQQEDSFFSDLKTAAVSGTRGLVSFVQGVILAVVYGWWLYLVLVVIALIVFRRIRRRRKETSAQMPPPYSPPKRESDTSDDTE